MGGCKKMHSTGKQETGNMTEQSLVMCMADQRPLDCKLIVGKPSIDQEATVKSTEGSGAAGGCEASGQHQRIRAVV